MSQDEAVKRWVESAEENLKEADDMFGLKHYDWALFFGQLALEKLLKAIIIQNTDEAPPYIHNLERLAKQADISMPDDDKNSLSEITTFHVAARYGNIKSDLYHKATHDFTVKYIEIIKYYYIWFKKQIKQP